MITDEPVSLDALALRIQSLRNGGLIGGASVYAIAMSDATGKEVPLQSVLRFEPPELEPELRSSEVITLGNIRLVRSPVSPNMIWTGENLMRAVHAAVGVGTGPAPSHVTAYNLHRDTGRQRWGPTPCWYVETGDYSVPYVGHLPSGPFFISKAGLCFELLSELACWWTGDTSREPTFRTRHGIVIPDCRAFFKRIQVRDGGLDIEVVRRATESLSVALFGTDLFGYQVVVHRKLSRVRVRLKTPRMLKSIRVCLLGDADSELYDQHRDLNVDMMDGIPLLSGPHLSHSESVELEESIARGEGPSTEFKVFIDMGASSFKAWEVLETAVAFANASGGVILIGVDNHGDVIGADAELLAAAKNKKADPVKLREEYAHCLRRRIILDIKPRLQCELTWIERRGKWILVVRVDKQVGDRCFIEQKKESFVRRGATNERLSPWDAARIAGDEAASAQHGGLNRRRRLF